MSQYLTTKKGSSFCLTKKKSNKKVTMNKENDEKLNISLIHPKKNKKVALRI